MQIDPKIAIKAVDGYVQKIDALLSKPHQEGQDERREVDTIIQNFIRTTFADGEARLKTYMNTVHPYPVLIYEKTDKEKQEEYILTLKNMRNNLVAFREVLQLNVETSKKSPQDKIFDKAAPLMNPDAKTTNIINIGKMVGSQLQQSTSDSLQLQSNSKTTVIRWTESRKRGYIAGTFSLLIGILFLIMVLQYGWTLTGQVFSAFGALFSILGLGSFAKPETVGDITAQILENMKANVEEDDYKPLRKSRKRKPR